MKILFLCGSLQRGEDGVSDYTHKLACALCKRGHQAAIVAFADRFLRDAPVELGALDERVAYMRLSAAVRLRCRRERFQAYLQEVDPDWVSVQFVPYAYANRGLCWPMARIFPRARRFQVHVHFHETWIGAEQNAAYCDRVIGWMQRASLRYVLQQWRMDVATTAVAPYRRMLAGVGVGAQEVCLCGNIPIAVAPAESTFLNLVKIPERDARDCLFLAVFGSLYPPWDPTRLLRDLVECAPRLGKKRVVVVCCGRQDKGAFEHFAAQATIQGQVEWVHLGVLGEDKISAVLSCCDYGLSTTPWSLIQKSGAAAAMLEHGLPVIVSRDDVCFESSPDDMKAYDPLLLKYTPGQAEAFSRALGGLKKREQAAKVNALADTFIDLFDQSRRGALCVS